MNIPTFVRETREGVAIEVHVQPKANRNEIVGVHDGNLKIRLTAPPTEGAANEECLRFLAKILQIPKSSLTIVQGLRSRKKTILVMDRTISGRTVGDLLEQKGLAL